MLTDEERAARKAVWFKNRDARRRIKYNKDPDYREAHKAASRDYFRAKYGLDSSTLKDCRRHYDDLEQFGKVREARYEDEADEFLTFTVSELAAVLGDYNPTIIRRWIKNHMLPAPVFEVTEVTGSFGREDGTSKMLVYTDEEVKRIIEILGEHQSRLAYFRQDHEDTITRIAKALIEVREELQLG